jgi:hypothetical protein
MFLRLQIIMTKNALKEHGIKIFIWENLVVIILMSEAG